MNCRLPLVCLFSAGLVVGAAALAGDAGTGQVPAPSFPPGKTGKERLSDKASDEQRVDDCNVPPERRGAAPRPSECDPRRLSTRTGSGGGTSSGD